MHLASIDLREFLLDADDCRPWNWGIAPLHAQYAMQWAIKRLLYLDNGPVRYRRDIAVMWPAHSGRPAPGRTHRVEAVERLLAVTAEDGGESCCLKAFVGARWRHIPLPVLGRGAMGRATALPGTGVQRG